MPPHIRRSSRLSTTFVPYTVCSLIVLIISYRQQIERLSILPNDGFVDALTLPGSCPPKSINKLLVVGLGRVGLQVSDLANSSKNPVQVEERDENIIQVVGTVRQSLLHEDKPDENDKLIRIPFDPIVVRKHLFGYNKDDDDNDDDNFDNNECSIPVSHVLFTIPLSREIDPIMEAVLDEIREWWKPSSNDDDDDNSNGNDNDNDNDNREINRPRVLGILSTTGVYGNHNGNVVNEDSSLLCEENSNAELYRRFENDWITLSGEKNEDNDKEDDDDDNVAPVNRLCIFRCAGIYDSSRSALHTTFRQGVRYGVTANSISTNDDDDVVAALPRSALSKPTTGNKTNRIHSVDLARGVLAGLMMSNSLPSNRIYNLADDQPELRSIVLSYAHKLLSSIDCVLSEDVPSTNMGDTMKKNAMSRSSVSRQSRRERESKLVCNKRMRQELLPDNGLLFPTYREGLNDIFNDPITPWRTTT
mmetsp:Transcript_35716/g.40141  ORF Transcript_35716/g.40141 Transcript_35716/m.40141 type:complete len:475 (+) Transcript_35716:50-1474(+)